MSANKKKKNSSPPVSHSPAQIETDQTTHSENLPTAPSTAEEMAWQEFQTAYAKLPHPGVKEPILYVEEKKEHDNLVLMEIQTHYYELKETLSKLAEIPISLQARMPQLTHAAAFQKEIPEYLRLCKRYIRTTGKARKALADQLQQDNVHHDETTSSTNPESFDSNSALMRTINARQQMHPHHRAQTVHEPPKENMAATLLDTERAFQQAPHREQTQPAVDTICLLYTSPSPRD